MRTIILHNINDITVNGVLKPGIFLYLLFLHTLHIELTGQAARKSTVY